MTRLGSMPEQIALAQYLVVSLVAASVGVSELVARYRDAPLDAVRRPPAVLYVAVNAVAGFTALVVIDAFGWTFGASDGFAAQIVEVAVAGLSALAVLRCSVFTVRVGDADVHCGPNALIRIILDAADRAVDRGRAQRRSQVVQEIMKNVDFEKAKQALPSDCLALMQNVPTEEQEAVTKEIESLEAEIALGEVLKARQLGLVLLNVVGEDVLRASVEALGGEIEPDGTST